MKQRLQRCRYAKKTHLKKLIDRFDNDSAVKFQMGSLLSLDDAPALSTEQTFEQDLATWQSKLNLSRNRLRSLRRTALLKTLRESKSYEWPDDFWEQHRRCACEAITHLEPESVRRDKSKLLFLAKKLGEASLLGGELDTYRRMLCYLDINLYK